VMTGSIAEAGAFSEVIVLSVHGRRSPASLPRSEGSTARSSSTQLISSRPGNSRHHRPAKQRVEGPGHDLYLTGQRQVRVRVHGAAMRAEREDRADVTEARGQQRKHAIPHRVVHPQPVQQNHRRPGPSLVVLDDAPALQHAPIPDLGQPGAPGRSRWPTSSACTRSCGTPPSRSSKSSNEEGDLRGLCGEDTVQVMCPRPRKKHTKHPRRLQRRHPDPDSGWAATCARRRQVESLSVI